MDIEVLVRLAAAFDGFPAGTEPRLFVRKDVKTFDKAKKKGQKAQAF